MKSICIYERNRGLGKCAGPIDPLRVENRRSSEWRGLEGLKARLKPSGEVPGVCAAHQERAAANGYLHGEAPLPVPDPAAEKARPADGGTAQGRKGARSRTGSKSGSRASGPDVGTGK